MKEFRCHLNNKYRNTYLQRQFSSAFLGAVYLIKYLHTIFMDALQQKIKYRLILKLQTNEQTNITDKLYGGTDGKKCLLP